MTTLPPARGYWGCLALLVAACSGSVDGEARMGRGVLVIAVDGLRADHLSVQGYDRPTTPVLDALASESVVFRKVYSTGSAPRPSHISLVTGCDPRMARRPPFVLPDGRVTNPLSGWYIPVEVPRLATEFLVAGYETAAFLDLPSLEANYGLDLGFHEFVEPSGRILGESLFRDHGIGQRFLDWLDGLDPGQDWFAYVHFNDLELLWRRPDEDWELYFPPRKGLEIVPPAAYADPTFFAIPRSRWNGTQHSLGEYESLYDSALVDFDRYLGNLITTLEKTGRWERTTLSVVGTYGVSFGESGMYLSAGSFSDCDLHVPWFLRPAPELGCHVGRASDQLVSLVDVAPTLMAMSGIAVPAGVHGHSLLPSLFGNESTVRRYAYATQSKLFGHVIMDERYCLESRSPGLDPESAARSWFGSPGPHGTGVQEYLHDRQADPKIVGHLAEPAHDKDASARLRSAAAEWADLILRARRVLHQPIWDEAESQQHAEEIVDLRRHGVIGDLR